jgi:two-component system LytT family sensor kinase
MRAYLQQELSNKNRWIYFKNGRWIVHVLYWLFVFFWGQNSMGLKGISVENFFLNFLWDNIFIASFYFFYCLYLVPVYFKNNRHIRFWIVLVALMLLWAFIDMCYESTFEKYLPKIYRDNWAISWAKYQLMLRLYFFNFLYFTTLLFFMELAEGHRTNIAIRKEMRELANTQQQLVKTRMNPAFVIRSLDGIASLTQQKNTAAPNAVIQFSDVLRYRLYKSAERVVPLQEELAQLNSLVLFHNNIHGHDGFCSMETEGTVQARFLPPLSLINLAEPLLDTYHTNAGWSMIIFMLVEEKELQLAVELSNPQYGGDTAFTALQQNLSTMFAQDTTFEIENLNSNYSIRICLPLQRPSAAS